MPAVTDAEIKQLVDGVMLRQEAKDAAAKWLGYHEFICGNGEKVSHYVDGWLAGWAACKQFGVLKPMETKQRDPLSDPQPSDKIYKIKPNGKRLSRLVVSRIDNCIVYIAQDGTKKECWISTWMEWGRDAQVEAEPVLTADEIADAKVVNAQIDGLAKKVINERKK